VVYLKALGYSRQEIGRIVRVSQPTVREYLEMYRIGGLEKLRDVHLSFIRGLGSIRIRHKPQCHCNDEEET
jgi:predicted transcriptional regulator